jgi:hypothetical protein
MTREEQIIEAAKEYYNPKNGAPFSLQMRTGFITGAKWADETMIEKACEWIAKKHHLYKELSFGSLSTDWHKLIKEFRKAMEE